LLEIVGLTRSWHGLQAGVASLNLAGGHAGYGPLLPGTFALPAPYAYRCPIRHCKGACDCSCLEAGFDLLDQQSGGTLQDVLFSPHIILFGCSRKRLGGTISREAMCIHCVFATWPLL